MRYLAIALLLAAGCTYETTGQSVLTMHLRASAGGCPDGNLVIDALTRDWVGGGFEYEGDACHTEEIVEANLETTQDGDSCCYPVSCTQALPLEREIDLYDAACSPIVCGHIDLQLFSAQSVRDDLVEYGLPCTLTADTPAQVPDIACLYRTDERWSCSREGG